MSDNEAQEELENDNDVEIVDEGEARHANQGRQRSAVWDRFTVIDKKNHIASCNSCEKRLSFRTTVTNLKKHITRKHPCAGYNSFKNHSFDDGSVRSRISFQRENKPFEIRKSKLTEIGGLEGLILNVIGDPETVAHDDEAHNEEEIYTEEIHDYCATTVDNRSKDEEKTSNKERRVSANKPQQTTDPMEKRKKIRLMDLQLECLEIKKYNMQLEARLLEQQLNIRRSIFTDSLQNADTITRGTQTEVGGEKTKIFYLTDGKGGVPTRHLFTMQELE